MGPERDDVRDHFVREARLREDCGKYRSQAHGVRLLVALPTTGRVDPRDVRIIGGQLVSDLTITWLDRAQSNRSVTLVRETM